MTCARLSLGQFGFSSETEQLVRVGPIGLATFRAAASQTAAHFVQRKAMDYPEKECRLLLRLGCPRSAFQKVTLARSRRLACHLARWLLSTRHLLEAIERSGCVVRPARTLMRLQSRLPDLEGV